MHLPGQLLSRIEDAGINASAPPQQRWVDGWLLRYSPGKAKRARCVQTVADGRLPLAQRLALCQAVFDAASLPMVVRITPFSRPVGLDDALAAQGWQRLDDTRVMVLPQLAPQLLSQLPEPSPVQTMPPPAGLLWQRLDAPAYADAVGALRGSPAGQRLAHAQRLAASPVPYQGWALRRVADALVLACGQTAAEADLVGLYDVFTHVLARGQGLATWVCRQLLAQAWDDGARSAYLQVEADNTPARAIYSRLGFVDAYSYHYRALVDPG